MTGEEVTGRDLEEVKKCVWYGSGLLSSLPKVSPSPQSDIPVATAPSRLPTISQQMPRSLTHGSLYTTVWLTASTVSPLSPQSLTLVAVSKEWHSQYSHSSLCTLACFSPPGEGSVRHQPSQKFPLTAFPPGSTASVLYASNTRTSSNEVFLIGLTTSPQLISFSSSFGKHYMHIVCQTSCKVLEIFFE